MSDALSRATDTKELHISSDAAARVPSLFRKWFPGASAVVISDENTHHAAGERVEGVLRVRGIPTAEHLVFPGRPRLDATYENVRKVRSHLRRITPPRGAAVGVAVGAGTVNDLVKLASGELGRRYLTVPTAASVDGYAAFGASITKDGYKQTLECPAPLVIAADLTVLQDAPPPMTASGFGDLVGKITAGADWIIADTVGAEAIDGPAWSMVQTNLRAWIRDPRRLKEGDADAVARLFTGLTMSGLAMQATRKSRPASGTEHLFSHYWEMQHLEVDGAPVSHGFKVAIGTLAATAFMETLFARSPGAAEVDRRARCWPDHRLREVDVRRAYAETPMLEQVVAASLAKHASASEIAPRLARIRSEWPEIKGRVSRQLLPYSQVRDMLAQAGCPITAESIGLCRDDVKSTFVLAQMFRNRYTALDLAYELGRLDECIGAVFDSPAGYLR